MTLANIHTTNNTFGPSIQRIAFPVARNLGNRFVCRSRKDAAWLLPILLMTALVLDALTARSQDPDPTFGTAGVAMVVAPGGSLQYNALALQPDGKIIAAGSSYQGGTSFGVVSRFNSDGTLDAPFGIGGSRFIGVTGWDVDLSAVVVLDDGRVAVTGNAYNDVFVRALVAVLEQDGDADPAFGGNGQVLLDLSSDVYTEGREIVQVDEGSVLIGGYYYDAFNSAYGDIMMVKYFLNGDLDTSYGVDGLFTHDRGEEDQLYCMAMSDDGGVLVGGATDTFFGPAKGFVVRVASGGVLDASFNGGAGEWLTADDAHITDLEVLDDGSVLSMSTEREGTNKYNTRITKLTPGGSVDIGFGSGGSTLFDDPGQLCYRDGTIEAFNNGHILACMPDQDNCTGAAGITFAGLLPTGEPNDFFSPDGLSYVDVPAPVVPGPVNPVSLAIDGGERLIIAGGTPMDSEIAGFVAAFEPIALAVDEEVIGIVRAWPNPADQWFNIEVGSANVSADIAILDALGREVNPPVVMSNSVLSCDVSGLVPGCYEVVLRQPEQVRISRMVVQH